MIDATYLVYLKIKEQYKVVERIFALNSTKPLGSLCYAGDHISYKKAVQIPNTNDCAT